MDDQITIQSADATELTLPIAGVGSRSYAFLLDWHIRFVLAMAWVLVVFLFLKLADGIELDLFTNNLWASVAWIPAFIIYFLYHPILEVTMHGRTPGKRMAGVRIVDLNGRTPGTGALIVRNIFRLVDSLPSLYMAGLTTCLFSKNAVRIGDMAAGTLLVKEQRASEADLDQLSLLANNTDYAPEHLELIQSLLSRWKNMDPPKRVELSEKILKKMDVRLPANMPSDRYDNNLFERLTAVQKGESF